MLLKSSPLPYFLLEGWEINIVGNLVSKLLLEIIRNKRFLQSHPCQKIRKHYVLLPDLRLKLQSLRTRHSVLDGNESRYAVIGEEGLDLGFSGRAAARVITFQDCS